MQFIKIKTRIFNLPKDNIFELIDESINSIKEGDVLFVTSKILSIHQGKCLKISEVKSKDELIISEAEQYIPKKESCVGDIILTIKKNTLIPTSGIDESNGDGYYVLWPDNINESAKEICNYLKKKFNIKKLAVIITDSYCTPLRFGVTGVSIGFYGIEPLKNYVGEKDIFDREIEHSQSNIVDAISAMSVLLMGEGDDRIPMLIMRDADFVEFTERDSYKDFVIPVEKDIYYPLLKGFS